MMDDTQDVLHVASRNRFMMKDEDRHRFLRQESQGHSPNRSKSTKSHQLKDRFIPGKVSSQMYRIMQSDRTESKRLALDQSTEQDINEMLRNETSMAKYTNLLRQNIIEEEPQQKAAADQYSSENAHPMTMMQPERSRSKGRTVLHYNKGQKRYKPYVFGNQEQSLEHSLKPIRKVAKQPYKILDAPKLRDDFYNSLLDWSSGNQIAIGLENIVYTWNAKTSEANKLMEVLTPTQISSVSWCGRQELLAVGDDHGTVKIYDVEKSKLLKVYDNHDQRVGTLDWNGYIVTSGSRDSNIFLSDIRTPRQSICNLNIHRQEVCGLKWSQSETLLASGGNDNKVMVTSLKMPSTPQSCFKDHVAAVKALAWSPHQSNTLASGGGTTDKTLKIWNVGSNSLIQSVDSGSQICNMRWSTNTDELVTTHGFSLNQIAIWQTDKAQRIATLYGHTFRVLYLAMSPDGESIVTGSGDETLRFWKVFPARKKHSFSHSQSQLDSNQIELR